MKRKVFFEKNQPGELKTTAEVKLLVCYILKTVEKPLSKEIIIKSIEQEGLANYFEVGQALSQLLDSKCILLTTDHETEFFSLTQLGLEVLIPLESSLSIYARKKAAKAAMRSLYRLKVERENKAEIIKSDSGYYIQLTILEGKLELMSITVRCADIYQAEEIKEQFLKRPKLLYRGTLALLIGDVESVGGFAAIADGLDF